MMPPRAGNPETRRSSPFHRVALVCGVVCAVFSLLAIGWPPARTVAEGGAYLLILALALGSGVARSCLAALRTWQKAAVGVFFALLVFGQLYDRPRKTYPFVSWKMYSNATEKDSTVTRLRARLADGRTVDIPDKPFPTPTLQVAPLLRRLHADADGGKKRILFERAIKSSYERRHPDRRIVALALYVGRFELETCKGEDSVKWTLIYESPAWN